MEKIAILTVTSYLSGVCSAAHDFGFYYCSSLFVHVSCALPLVGKSPHVVFGIRTFQEILEGAWVHNKGVMLRSIINSRIV